MTGRHKEKVTVLIIPDEGRGPVSLKVPLYIPRFILAAAVAVLIFLATLIHSFMYMSSHISSQEEELDYLQAVTRAQKVEISRLDGETRQLALQVRLVEDLSSQVRGILGLQKEDDQEGMDDEEAYVDHQQAVRPFALADRGGFRLAVSPLEAAQLQVVLEVQERELQGLMDAAQEYRHRMDHTPSVWPTQGRITSHFGYRRSPFTRRREFHGGIDIGNSRGTPVVAAAHGQVVEAAFRSGWGRLIIIDHGYGYQTYYAHLQRFSASVGDDVTKGQVIGTMGSSGNTTGPHLHYEVRFEGERMNPLDYMQ